MGKEFEVELKVKARVSYDDNESDEETARYCLEQDLRDAGWNCDVEVTAEKDVILDTYNNLMICPHCDEIIDTTHDYTPKYCKECGNLLSGGIQYKE